MSNLVEKKKRKKRQDLLVELEECSNIQDLKALIKKIIELDNERSL